MDKKLLLLTLICLPLSLFAQEEVSFDEYFIDQTMRIDYFHNGDASEEIFILDRIYQQTFWAGTRSRAPI